MQNTQLIHKVRFMHSVCLGVFEIDNNLVKTGANR